MTTYILNWGVFFDELPGGGERYWQLIVAGTGWTPPDNEWIQGLYDFLTPILGERPRPRSVSYFTDAASLRRAYHYPPTVTLGPGEPEMAHQSDEYCRDAKIQEAVEVYSQIIRSWCRL